MTNSRPIRMTDQEAAELLRLLLRYHRETAGDQDSREMTVGDLAGDLINSIPQHFEPPGCRELID